MQNTDPTFGPVVLIKGSPTARGCTYEFTPVVGMKVLWPRKRDIGNFIMANGRTLLHDTMLTEDSYGTGTAESPMCECARPR